MQSSRNVRGAPTFSRSTGGSSTSPAGSVRASKWAIRGFSSALRAELYGSEIGVTTVYPEWVDTPMVRQEGNVETFEIADLRFHVALIAASRNEVMLLVMKALREAHCTGSLIPDHYPGLVSDTNRRLANAYTIAYMRALLRRANEEVG